MVIKGQFVGLDWNRIARLHSQVMTGTRETHYKQHLAVTFRHIEIQPTNLQSEYIKVIPEFCIAHSYCARILRHQRAHMSARAYKT